MPSVEVGSDGFAGLTVASVLGAFVRLTWPRHAEVAPTELGAALETGFEVVGGVGAATTFVACEVDDGTALQALVNRGESHCRSVDIHFRWLWLRRDATRLLSRRESNKGKGRPRTASGFSDAAAGIDDAACLASTGAGP